MNALESQLKNFLQKEYVDSDKFLENIIFPVFGEENFQSNGNLNVLKKKPELQAKADASGILAIKSVGELFIQGSELGIFDITLDFKKQLSRNRVEIQQIVRQIISTHSGAFIIFHYQSGARWEWRFTFCHKGANNLDSSDAKRYTFLLGPGQSCRTAAENFVKIHDKIASEGEFEIDDVIKAFDVEALSKEFFGKYKEQYNLFCNFVYEHRNDRNYFGPEFTTWEDKIIRDYVKKLLGRIIFLHFLQKKGWMGVPADKEWGDGDLQFMKHLFENATPQQKDNYLDAVLEPLFAKALDTDRTASDDLYDTGVEGFRNIKIPYLNGGLFERDYLDTPASRFDVSLFDGLFEMLYQYNFTIDENDPNDAQVGVDPEMLGRIFENLLEDNKDKGAFYTPKEIVQYMCRESLIAYLQTEVTDEETKDTIRQFVSTYDVSLLTEEQKATIDEKLQSVKICDPAIGSGAFPMGMLRELFFCRSAIEGLEGKQAANIKKHIIQQNIYGVDIEKGAVDIARLRFWLTLIIDEETPHALPNLDFKIMQGNSLLEQYEGVNLSGLAKGQALGNASKKRIIKSESDRKGKKGLDNSLQMGLLFDKATAIHNIQSNLSAYYSQDDHSKRQEMREAINAAVHEYIKETLPPDSPIIDEVDNLPLENDQFFLWNTWFNEVFEGEKPGFDIVIGNPPYGANIDNLVDVYGKLYPDTSHGHKDIYKYFFECFLNKTKENGILCYITPNTFLRQPRYGDLRRILLRYNLEQILDLGENIFEEAVVPVAITLLRRSDIKEKVFFVDLTKEIDNNNAEEILATFRFISLGQNNWDKTPNNIFIENIVEVTTETVSLEDIMKFKDAGINYQRVNVGLAQKGKSDLSSRLLYEGERESSSHIEFWKGTDINEYYIAPKTDRYCRPNIQLASNERVILNADYFAIAPKLIWRQTAPYPISTVDYDGVWFGRSIQAGIIDSKYTSKISYEYLCGLLNSKYLRYLYEQNVKEGGRVFPQVKLEKLKPLPIVIPSAEQKADIENLVTRTISATRKGDLDTAQLLKATIDQKVFELYNIEPSSIM